MNDADFLIAQNDLKPTEPPPASVVAWAEARRVLPANTPWPGPYHYERTPYQREICENLAPYSPVVNTIVLKSRKVGLTTSMENCIAYWMFAWPTDIIYATASESLAKQWSQESIMGVIDSMGYRDRLIAQFSNNKNKRSPATAKRIEYSGGKLDIMSSASVEARRQKNSRCIFLDEVDGTPEMTTTGEGSYVDILKGHSMSWGARRKFCAFSSPTTFEASAIWKLYLEGDCRKFLVPCPVCGEHIELRLDVDDGSGFGLKAETEGGKTLDVYYLCERCGEPIRNQDKSTFYSDSPRCRRDPRKKVEPARWEPTRKTDDPFSRSYSINALYSPLGALTFRDVYEAKKKAEEEGPDAMRAYVNIYQGLPYKDSGQRPKAEKVIELRGGYKAGTVPKDVLFLSMAVDVQKGSEKDERNPPRLELEVLGHGLGYRTWSVLYRRFEGATDDAFAGAWEKLDEWAKGGGLLFTRADGTQMKVQIVFIDSGDQADVVYQFCGEWVNTFPSKGFGFIKADRKSREKGDIPGAGNYRRWREARFGGNVVYEISTNYYKTLLYNRLKIERIPSEPQKPGFCEFPVDYPREYFDMLTAEEKRTDGSFHKVGPRNEALDCRVYNLCAADIWLAAQVQNWRLYFQSQGASSMQILQVNSRFVLERLEKNPNMVIPKIRA